MSLLHNAMEYSPYAKSLKQHFRPSTGFVKPPKLLDSDVQQISTSEEEQFILTVCASHSCILRLVFVWPIRTAEDQSLMKPTGSHIRHVTDTENRNKPLAFKAGWLRWHTVWLSLHVMSQKWLGYYWPQSQRQRRCCTDRESISDHQRVQALSYHYPELNCRHQWAYDWISVGVDSSMQMHRCGKHQSMRFCWF